MLSKKNTDFHRYLTINHSISPSQINLMIVYLIPIKIKYQTEQLKMIIYEEILREFQKQGVKYIIVGGIAFNLLGGLRSTADLDILVEMSDDNLKKLVNILKKHGFAVKQPVDPIDIADRKTREDWINNKHMKAFNFYKRQGLQEVDIIIDSPVSYEEAGKDTKYITAGGIRLPIISIDNLITMKKNTHRSIDIIDIEELQKIKKLKGEK